MHTVRDTTLGTGEQREHLALKQYGIVVISDSDADYYNLRASLARAKADHYALTAVGLDDQPEKAIEDHSSDAVILAYSHESEHLLLLAKHQQPERPVIVLLDEENPELAEQLKDEGATACLQRGNISDDQLREVLDEHLTNGAAAWVETEGEALELDADDWELDDLDVPELDLSELNTPTSTQSEAENAQQGVDSHRDDIDEEDGTTESESALEEFDLPEFDAAELNVPELDAAELHTVETGFAELKQLEEDRLDRELQEDGDGESPLPEIDLIEINKPEMDRLKATGFDLSLLEAKNASADDNDRETKYAEASDRDDLEVEEFLTPSQEETATAAEISDEITAANTSQATTGTAASLIPRAGLLLLAIAIMFGLGYWLNGRLTAVDQAQQSPTESLVVTRVQQIDERLARLEDITDQILEQLNALAARKPPVDNSATLDVAPAVEPANDGEDSTVTPTAVASSEPERTEPPTEELEGIGDLPVKTVAPENAAVPAATGGWVINLGSFSSLARAESWVASLDMLAENPVIKQVQAGDKTIYRVQLTGFLDSTSATRTAREYEKELSQQGFWVGRDG